MGPEHKENVISCSICGRLDNVGLYTEIAGIMWCACGAVFTFKCDGINITEMRQVYVFE